MTAAPTTAGPSSARVVGCPAGATPDVWSDVTGTGSSRLPIGAGRDGPPSTDHRPASAF